MEDILKAVNREVSNLDKDTDGGIDDGGGNSDKNYGDNDGGTGDGGDTNYDDYCDFMYVYS